MKTDVLLLPEALEELASAIAQYGTIETALGERFEQACWHTIDQVAQRPMQFGLVAAGVRRARLRRFPWGIVYTINHDHFLVVAVMHLHRKPGYWRDRLTQN